MKIIKNLKEIKKMILNTKKIDEMVRQKYITKQRHPDADLYIYNYTQKAQFDKVWNEETTMCRGLILDGQGKVVARPFKKFFNLSEHESDEKVDIPNEPFKVYEKMDGSLGIVYFDNLMPFIATRGSFTSEQAIEGTKILREKYPDVSFLPQFTYLFEIIYPQNKIVVDYGKTRDLYLLAVIDKDNGKDYQGELEDTYSWGGNGPRNKFPTPKTYDYTSIEEITELMTKGNGEDEGFVIKFKSGMRVKIKYDEYVRLHRLITGVNARRIWDLLRNGQTTKELTRRVPEEFLTWVEKTSKDLMSSFSLNEMVAKKIYSEAKKLETRKEQAELILSKNNNLQGVCFAMLSDKDYKSIIWKLIRPKAEKPFVDVSDDI